MCSAPPRILPLLPWLLVLTSCSTPPRPPQVDESTRRPANTAMAVELQVCKSDLQNTRLQAAESGRIAATASVTLAQLTARLASSQPAPAATTVGDTANRIFTIRFDFGSARVVVPTDTERPLIDAARTAPLVLLRGRTDGSTEAPGEARIARERTDAVQRYLVTAGVDPAHIRATYQPIGDHVADNSTPTGRAANRRVEIELYRVAPVAMVTRTVTPGNRAPDAEPGPL